MELIWAVDGISEKELSLLAAEAIGWNKNTTYTILKKLVAKDALAAAGDRHLSRPRQRARSAGGEHRPGCRGLFPDRLSSRRSAQPA
ncbi:MAG: BlaI/MecI/CopY family transcriptional regulator [Oscillospiraceae bacterium]|nr:BlaI/MecI/CopY family transcriptional regulator [Oscillospiraceae bacterium]